MIAQVVRFKSGMTDEQVVETYLRRTIPAAYQVQGAPDIRTAEVVMTLHPE